MARAFADGAIIGARIRTLDPARPAASAVAWRDGTIIAVGDEAAVRECCDARTVIRQLAGTGLVPGLTDSHIHPFHGADSAVGADLTGLRTLEQVLAALRAERASCAAGQWVQGYALTYEAFEETGIDGALFERAVGDAPALITFFDFHTALASPSALRLAGVDGPRTFAEASEIVCLQGIPTGELRERAAMELVRDAIPEPTHAERLERIRGTLRGLNANGITGAHVMLASAGLYDVYRELDEAGDLTVRCVVPLHQAPGVSDEAVEADLALRDVRGRTWRGGAAKFFIDGVVEPGTAWLDEPDSAGTGVTPFWPDPARYAGLVGRFARAGFQCITHAVGDRAVRAALDAYRDAGAAPGVMHRIEHVETLQDHDLPRFAVENVAASMQPLHMENNSGEQTDPWSRMLGTERANRAFRTRDLIDSGALVALGSDWPIARYDPRRGMGWARLRREPGRREMVPCIASQALTPLEALHGYTIAPARLAGEGAVAGRIAVGCRADLTAFAADPVEIDADELLDLPVVLTILGGRVVHDTA